MRGPRFDIWIQLSTVVAIVVGLGLVVFELRQTKALSEANFVATRYQTNTQVNSPFYGEDAASALVKACLDPASLTPEQKLIIDIYYWDTINIHAMTEQTSSVAGLAIDLDRSRAVTLSRVFGTAAGREWWDRHRLRIDPELRAVGDEQLLQLNDDYRCYEIYGEHDLHGDA